jgi:hypothetical protein
MIFSSSIIPGHGNELSASKNIMCKPLRDAFLQNIDAIIQLEVVNFMLKKDDLYTERYSEYYDHALSHFDVRTLLKAIDVIAANCPVSAKGN